MKKSRGLQSSKYGFVQKIVKSKKLVKKNIDFLRTAVLKRGKGTPLQVTSWWSWGGGENAPNCHLKLQLTRDTFSGKPFQCIIVTEYFDPQINPLYADTALDSAHSSANKCLQQCFSTFSLNGAKSRLKSLSE